MDIDLEKFFDRVHHQLGFPSRDIRGQLHLLQDACGHAAGHLALEGAIDSLKGDAFEAAVASYLAPGETYRADEFGFASLRTREQFRTRCSSTCVPDFVIPSARIVACDVTAGNVGDGEAAKPFDETIAQAGNEESDELSCNARLRQRDQEWKRKYRATRPKVERKIAHLMRRRHGGRRTPVRGRSRVKDDFSLLCANANLKRLAKLGLHRHDDSWAAIAFLPLAAAFCCVSTATRWLSQRTMSSPRPAFCGTQGIWCLTANS